MKYFRPGQLLFKEGEPSHAMYLVKKGTVSVRKRKGGAFVELARIYSNEVIGELSFFDRHPRSASAVALTEVEVMEISFASLEVIEKTIPDYLKTIMISVAERLRKADDLIRKLQKEVVVEGVQENEVGEDAEYQNAAAVLAATADIAFGSGSTSAAQSKKNPKKD